MAAKRHLLPATRWTASVMPLVMLLYLAWPILSAKPISHPERNTVQDPQEWFDRQYSLGEGEFVRFVVPPLQPGLPRVFGKSGMIWFYQASYPSWGTSTETGTLLQALMNAGALTCAEIEVPPELAAIAVNGDWIVRGRAKPDQRIPQLEQILRARLKRDIHVTKRITKTDAVVARGNWSLRSLPGGTLGNDLYLFIGDRYKNQGAGYGDDNVLGLFKRLENITRHHFVDDTRSKPLDVVWHDDSSLQNVALDPPKLRRLLDNVASQTSLTFTLEPREYPVYVVTEGSKNAN
jgi:hypothetical protein